MSESLKQGLIAAVAAMLFCLAVSLLIKELDILEKISEALHLNLRVMREMQL